MPEKSFGSLESAIMYQPYFKKRETEIGTKLVYVLISGGPDSATALGQVRNQSNEKDTEIRGLFVNFGQPYANQEFEAATKVTNDFNVTLEVLDLPVLSETFKGIGELGYPIFRELLPAIIGIAALHAIFQGSNELYHGNILEDELDIPGTLSFFKAIQDAINCLPGAEDFRIKIPFGGTPKSKVLVKAVENNVKLENTASCLQDGGHCGVCRSCLRRAKAFDDSGIEDPTEYTTDPRDGLTNR